VHYLRDVAERAVIVLGGGFAGLCTSLLLAREGHPVTLVEQDPVVATTVEQAWATQRQGIPHLRQPAG
jgi:glycine/D-amino acid oxidase-like deaminating enzyme